MTGRLPGEGTVLARALRRNKAEPAKASGKWRNPIPVLRSEVASLIGESQPGRGTWNRTAIPRRMERSAKEIPEWILAKVNGVGPQASLQQKASPGQHAHQRGSNPRALDSLLRARACRVARWCGSTTSTARPSSGIKESKQATNWTRLSCHRFWANEVRLQLAVLAYNLGNLWRRLVLPQRIEKWSLTSLQQRLVKTGGRLVKHARYYWLLLAEGHLTRRLFASMLGRIDGLALPSGIAWATAHKKTMPLSPRYGELSEKAGFGC